ncbi:MAG: primosomal protein N' [Erysipelotrichaceae bacterium]|nr:primosomal protein N' [Erysipelotrichaceae bacterium]
MILAKIWMEHSARALNRTFTYDVSQFSVKPGMRVHVPFGTQKLVGFVDQVWEDRREKKEIEAQQGFEIKSVYDVIDQEPVLNEELMNLGKWLAKETVSPVISCYQCMVPPPLKPKEVTKEARKIAYYRFVREPDRITARQKAVLDMCRLQDCERSVMNKESASIVRRLLTIGAICLVEKEKEAGVTVEVRKEEGKMLTEQQQKAMDEMLTSPKVSLLHGVTGSGKTELYLQMADRCLQQHKQVLILVPEISLTPMMVQRVTRRFCQAVAIYHSGLSAQEKYEQYQLVRNNKVQVVVGTRSAVFMPFTDLGLIVLDEEHDSSYKQDTQVRYHCRDVAIYRARTHNAKVVLGSATPSLESYARTLKNVYQLVKLPHRIYGDLPNVEVVNMKEEIAAGNEILSSSLKKELHDCLMNKQQAILLLNRRGYSPVLRCESCSTVLQCPHCDVALSYHKDDRTLKCHICGNSYSLNRACRCGCRKFTFVGTGTQRLQEELQKEFPDASILRLDADVARKKGAHKDVLDTFGSGKADILLGTQMIAKGLDFPNVTVVGILNADAALHRADYRCVEMTFDLLVQASGRSGRGVQDGKVIVQAYDPNHYAIQLAVKQDYETFFSYEMKYRHSAMYPPYRYFASLLAMSGKAEDGLEALEQAKEYFKQKGLQVYGVSELPKHTDQYRCRILLCSPDSDRLKDELAVWYESLPGSKVSYAIDINPLLLES